MYCFKIWLLYPTSTDVALQLDNTGLFGIGDYFSKTLLTSLSIIIESTEKDLSDA